MKSAVAVTYALDTESAVDEIVAQVLGSLGPKPDATSRCGIFFSEGAEDCDELVAELHGRLGYPVVGCTSLAQISSRGYHQLSATLLTLEGDDCRFGTAVASCEGDNPEGAIREMFGRAAAELDGTPWEAVFVFSTQSPTITEDKKLALINELADGKPVFGGVASDYLEFSNVRVFRDDQCLNNAVSILLIGGNVRPRFAMHNIPRTRLAKLRVTGARGNVVTHIDGKTAYEVMREFGIDTEDPAKLLYVPVCVELENEDDYDGVPICRQFVSMDAVSGEGLAYAEIPEGATVSIQEIQSADLETTTRDALSEVLGQLASPPDGYSYSTVFIVSCAGRHMVWGMDKAREGSLAVEMLPADISFAGFYTYGEFCPTSVTDGRAKNRMNNLSIGFCVM